MTLDEVLEEALCWHEAFRRLGFQSEDLFIAADPEDIMVILRTQGLEFVGLAGPYAGPKENLMELWERKTEEWNSIPASTGWHDRLWNKSFVANHSSELCLKLVKKGFALPAATHYIAKRMSGGFWQ